MPSAAPHWIEVGHGAPALLCLHGISGGAGVWHALLPHFAGDGRRVLAWDMPGYGRSAPPGEAGMAGYSAALERLLEAACLERVVLIGHSLGGMIALEAATHLSERIEAMVLACTTPAFGAPAGAAQKNFLERRLGPLARGGSMEQLAAEVIPTMLGPNASADLLREHCTVMGGIPQESYQAAMHALVAFDRRAVLAEITCPVLCVAGEEDRVALPLVMQRMAAGLPAGRFASIPGAGHLAPFEQPGAFASLVGDFLAAPGARSGG